MPAGTAGAWQQRHLHSLPSGRTLSRRASGRHQDIALLRAPPCTAHAARAHSGQWRIAFPGGTTYRLFAGSNFHALSIFSAYQYAVGVERPHPHSAGTRTRMARARAGARRRAHTTSAPGYQCCTRHARSNTRGRRCVLDLTSIHSFTTVVSPAIF